MSGDEGVIRLLVAVLACTRLTSLLLVEDGPSRVFARARDWLNQRTQAGPLAGLFDCAWCLSIWMAVPVTILALLPNQWWWLLLPLAVSQCTIMLLRWLAVA